MYGRRWGYAMQPDEEGGPSEQEGHLRQLPDAAHQAFAETASHLEEVRFNHQKLLVGAGLVPETHLANIDPERQVQWLAESFNGKVTESGFSLPLLGLGEEDVGLSVSSDNGLFTLKMELGDHIQRSARLPVGVVGISSSWQDGWLNITFDRPGGQ